MEFFELVGERQSSRSFAEKPVEGEKLRSILDAVSTAPSAGNLRAYEVSVVRNIGQKILLAQAALGQDFVARASLVLVFSSNVRKSRERYGERAELYAVQDATIACAYAQLAATDLGLGSCWVGAFDETQVVSAIELRHGLKPIALLPLGHFSE